MSFISKNIINSFTVLLGLIGLVIIGGIFILFFVRSKANTKAIRSKQIIEPVIELRVENNQVDTVYLYEVE